MLLACWSTKGGSGTTVVAVALASLLARRAPAGALLVDLAGDVAPVLGMSESAGPGIGEWLDAGADVPADALPRLEVAGPGHLRVLVRGVGGELVGARGDVLAALLSADSRPVVADCGTSPAGAALAVACAATASLLVVRPCYLALRRARLATIRPTGIVLVRETGRALGRAEVEDVVGAPVLAEVAVDEAVARAVDSGLLAHRLPRSLDRALRRVA